MYFIAIFWRSTVAASSAFDSYSRGIFRMRLIFVLISLLESRLSRVASVSCARLFIDENSKC